MYSYLTHIQIQIAITIIKIQNSSIRQKIPSLVLTLPMPLRPGNHGIFLFIFNLVFQNINGIIRHKISETGFFHLAQCLWDSFQGCLQQVCSFSLPNAGLFYGSTPVCLPTRWRAFGFAVSDIINRAAINIHERLFVWIDIIISLGKTMPDWMGIVSHHHVGNPLMTMWYFKGNLKTNNQTLFSCIHLLAQNSNIQPQLFL